MTATTPTYAIPYPEATDPPNGPSQMQALALAVEALIAANAALIAANTAAANARAKGVVGAASIGTSADVGTTEVITDSVTFTAEAGRAYRVSVMTPVLDNQATASQTAITTIRWASGATVSNAGSLIAKGIGNTPGVTGSSSPGSAAETITMIGYINNPPAGQVTVGLGLAASSASSNVRYLASGTTGPDKAGILFVEDVGPTY